MAAGPLKILKTLAILFEQRFYSWKKEHACLDFDDLQLKALSLFSRDDDIGAIPRRAQCDRLADPPAAPRDEERFTFQIRS